MPDFLRRISILGCVLLLTAFWQNAQAQCIGLPTVATLGSNKFPFGFCSPVSARITYNVSFISNVPNGTIEIVVDWGDGTTQILPRATGTNSYSADVTHPFPTNSDCEFLVTVAMRYNGVLCPTTRQIQKVASWRTDEFNGGNVQLISPVTGTNEHLVCAGQDISVIFNDLTNFNCNANYVHTPPQSIETPNTEHRWQQIIYNTLNGANVIPNVSVNGAPVTDASGNPIVSNLQDPRGVNYMATPVVLNDPRRRATLPITAPGGFGPAFPQVGDVFEIRIRYWNFCNPYSNNPGNPMVPVNGNLINGDNPPVERTALVRIVAAPPAPTGGDQTVCNGTTPSPFQVNGVPGGHIVNFYRDNAGVPGALIGAPSTSTTLAVTSHPNWAGTANTARVYRVWASYRPNVVGSCESPRILITRTIREAPTVPDPAIAPPAEICNRDNSNNPNTFQIVMPPGQPAVEPIGGATGFTWTTSLPSGISLTSSTATSATYTTNVAFAPGELFQDKTIVINRFFTTSPSCSRTRSFTIRVYNTAVGGTPSPVPDVCETTPVGTITLSGHRGELVGWEVSLNGGPFGPYTGPASGNSITPGLLTEGVYRFRAVVRSSASFANGPCGPVFSAIEQVEVFDDPDPAQTGIDQAKCEIVYPAVSDPLGGSDPGSGTGSWTFVSVLPATAPAPTFTANDRNTTITVSEPGAYVMRWTVTNGSCVSSDDIVVDFGGNPTDPDAGPDKAVCGLTTDLEGNTPTTGNGFWTLVSAPPGGTVDIVNPASPDATLNLLAPFTYGAYTFRYTMSSGSCIPVKTDDVIITFFEIPVANSSDVATICIGPGPVFAAIPLSGTIGGAVLDGTWQNVSGNGTVSATTLNGANWEATYTPTIDDYNAGVPITVKLVANPVAGSPCTPAEAVININIDRTPQVNPGSDIPNICGDAIQLNAENPPPFGATGLWTTAGAVTFDNPAIANTFVRGLPMGTTQLTWTLTSASGLCSANETIDLTRVPLPAPDPLSVLECETLPPGGPITTTIVLSSYENSFTGTVPAAGNRDVTWYRNAPPPIGTVVASPSIPENNITDGQVFIARFRDLTTNCVADGQLTINVRPLPPAADAIVAVCETDPVNDPDAARNLDLTTATFVNPVTGGAANVDIQWFNTFADAVAETGEILAPIDVINSRILHARITYNDAAPGCPDFAEIEVRVNSIPDVSDISGDPTVCMGAAGADIATLPIETYQVPSIPGATYTWNIPQGADEFVVFGGGGPGDFFVFLKFPFTALDPVPDLNISVTIDVNGCVTPPISRTIVRAATPLAPTINGPIVVCEGSQLVSFDVAGAAPTDNFTWEIRRESDNELGGAFINSGQTTGEIDVNFLAENVIISVREENGQCVGPQESKPVRVHRNPIMTNQLWSVCSDQPSPILLDQDPSSPVAIDYFTIPATPGSIVIDPRLNVIPPSAPAPGNGPTTMLQGQEFKNTAEIPLQVIYKVSPVSEETFNAVTTVCRGPEQNVILTVNPEPILESGLGKNICSEEQTEITLRTTIASYPADRYVITSIEQTTNPGVPLLPANVNAPLNTDLNADAIFTDAWINPGAPVHSGQDPFIITYMIAAKSTVTGCQGFPSVPVPVRVFPVPNLPATMDVERCSGDLLDVTFDATNVASAQYTWSIANIDPQISGATPRISPVANPATINDVLMNSNATVVGRVVYNVLAEFTNGKTCSTNTLLTVDVKPAPTILPLPVLEECSDAVGNLIATVDLTSLEPSITAATNNIVWYETDPTNPGAVLIADPTAYAAQDNVPFFAEVADPLSGCVKVVNLNYNINPAVRLALAKTDVSCFGANNGTITASADVGTGTGPFNYTIDGGPPAASSGSYVFQNLGPGSYTIAIEDANRCTHELSNQIIVEPLNMIVSNLQPEDVSCFFDLTGKDRDGTITITATGGPTETNTGTGSYNYTLFPGNITTTDGVFTGLKRGFYTVRVSDATTPSCQIEANSIEIGFPDPVEIVSVIVPDDGFGNNVSCFGATNGEIRVTAQGGTGTFNFSLDPIHPSNPIVQPANVEAIFANLGVGTYKILVEDQKQCKAPQSSAIISGPSVLTPGVVGSDQDVCPENLANQLTEIVPAFGGTSAQNYEYVWQFALTPGPDDGDNDPLNDTGWATIPASNSSQLDPNGTLPRDPDVNPIVYYRRLVRDVSPLANTPASCLVFKTPVKPIEIRNRMQPVVQPLGPSIVCEGVQSFVQLEMVQGKEPMTFDVRYDYMNGNFDLLPNRNAGRLSENFEIRSPELTPTPVVRFENVRDAFGCRAADVVFTYEFQLKPTLAIANPAQCADATFEFSFTPDPNLDYVMSFGDGTADFPIPAGSSPTMPITHQFPAGSTSVNTQYTVSLTYSGACANKTTGQITVFPSIARNILQPSSDICEGQTVIYRDNSLGITSATWQYQYLDDANNVVLGPVINTTGDDVSFTFDNPTATKDPLAYTVVYVGRNNQNCTTTETLGPINVYRNPAASFVFDPASPQMVGGLVDVTYTIADHTPLFFDYEWPNDTEDISSEIRSGNQRIVSYTSDDDRTVTLVVTNKLNGNCRDTETLIVPINRGTPTVGFAATPLAGCFPITVTTENFSVNANTFEWTLIGSDGSREESEMREPRFRITSPGTYTLTLLAFDDGVPAGPPLSRTIVVFDQPIADFLLRQTQVYIGQEVEPINLSLAATEFLWEFGDGETSIDFQPRHKYTLEGRDSITLIAKHDNGQFDIDGDGILDGAVICADTTKQAITIIAGGALKIPNAFTPDTSGPNSGQEDGNFRNDVFLPIMEGVEEFTMQIFDRWGTLLFESRDKTIGWNGYDRNGRLMPAGVYVFKLVMRLGDGQRTTKIGDVTLIR